MKGRAAVYARASTSSQTTRQQLDKLELAAPGARAYVDEALSGSSADRLAFRALRQDVAAGRVSAVYATKLDRIGRSARSVLEFLDQCEQCGVRVILTDQSLDTGTPVGRLLRTVAAAFAEFEGDLIRERTRDAMAAIKAGTRQTRSGLPPGKPPRLTEEKVATILKERSRDPPTSYRDLSLRLGLKIGTCRRAYSLASRGQPAFVKPPVRKGSRALGTDIRFQTVPYERPS